MGYKTYTCPIARRCGGCEWLAVPYPLQLRRKQEQVTELFGAMAAADDAQVDDVLGMDEPLHYRHKAATPFAPGAHGHLRSGFYEKGSHRIVACDACLAEDPRARQVLAAVAEVAGRLRIPAYNEDRGTGCLRHAVVRTSYATDDILLTVVTNGPDLPRRDQFVRQLRAAYPQVSSIVQNINERRTNAILGFRSHTLAGPGTMRDKLLGCSFEIGPTAFYQTNPVQTERLYALALEGAALEGGERLLDAYCGCGTIGICAAAAAREQGRDIQVLGIEQVRGAVKAAKHNAQSNRLADRCAFVQGDATAWLTSGKAAAAGGFDAAILDPPRAGSTPEFLGALAAGLPGRIVYVSCNVVTLARDLAFLRERGYRLRRVSPVDMFPHTKHVECVAVLSRADG